MFALYSTRPRKQFKISAATACGRRNRRRLANYGGYSPAGQLQPGTEEKAGQIP